MTSTPAGVDDAVAHVFVDALDDRCEITGRDGHHLQRVRRLRAGECITAADGSGAWRAYDIVAVDAGRLVLVARGDVQIEAAPVVELAIGVALAKGGLDAVVTQLTEAGVARVIPVETARTVVRWDGPKEATAVARLRVAAREAAMQSRRARIPQIERLARFADVAGRPGLILADRTGCRVNDLRLPDSRVWTVLVGPEGGFADEEREQLAGRPRLALAEHVLRAATAPVAAAVLLGDRIAQQGHA